MIFHPASLVRLRFCLIMPYTYLSSSWCTSIKSDNRSYFTLVQDLFPLLTLKTEFTFTLYQKETNISETFEEYGTMPLDTVDKNKTVSADIVEMIKNGCSDTEILERYPSCFNKLKSIESTRQIILSQKHSEMFRKVEVTYIYGDTGTGKTRYVMDTHGYKNVYKITDYTHPFDNYKCEDIILFDEFRSSLTLKDMLQYLDGYPLSLPARYENKTACFTKVYIVSNISLNQQYRNIQAEEPESWNAFVRRIKNIMEFSYTNNGLPFSNEEIQKIEYFPSDYYIGGDESV